MAGASPTASVRLNDAALDEAKAAARFYENLRPGYGDLFQRRLDECLGRVAEHPESYQRADGAYRRAFLRHFPFVVVYRVLPHEIEVVGVLPERDDPKILTRRTASVAGDAD